MCLQWSFLNESLYSNFKDLSSFNWKILNIGSVKGGVWNKPMRTGWDLLYGSCSRRRRHPRRGSQVEMVRQLHKGFIWFQSVDSRNRPQKTTVGKLSTPAWSQSKPKPTKMSIPQKWLNLLVLLGLWKEFKQCVEKLEVDGGRVSSNNLDDLTDWGYRLTFGYLINILESDLGLFTL